MIPPVEVAKEGWWMVARGALSRRAVQTQVGEGLKEPWIVWVDTGGTVGEPVIGDVDGDGINEVVDLKHRELRVLDVPRQIVEWRFTPPDSAYFGDACHENTPALGDVDGDGVVEIVAMDDYHRLWILDAVSQQVDKMIQFPIFYPGYQGRECPHSPPFVVDLEGDGTPGILVGGQGPTSDTRTYLYYILPCYARTGDQCQDTLMWRKEISVWEPPPLPMGDYNGDESLEMSFWDFLPEPNQLTVLKADGTVLWSRTPPNGDSMALPQAVLDLDNDEAKELVVVGSRWITYVLDAATGNLKWDFPTCGTLLMAFADIDLDGQIELFCGWGFRTVRALTPYGYVKWQTVLPTTPGSGLGSRPIIGDFHPSPGLESFICTLPEGLFLLSSRGEVLWAEYQVYTPCGAAAGDVDGDGFSELVVNGRYGTYIFDRPTDVEETPSEPSGEDHGFRLIPGGFALRRPYPVTVYDLTGRKVFSGKTRLLRLLPGGYVVHLPETTLKMVIPLPAP